MNYNTIDFSKETKINKFVADFRKVMQREKSFKNIEHNEIKTNFILFEYIVLNLIRSIFIASRLHDYVTLTDEFAKDVTQRIYKDYFDEIEEEDVDAYIECEL